MKLNTDMPMAPAGIITNLIYIGLWLIGILKSIDSLSLEPSTSSGVQNLFWQNRKAPC